MLSTYSSGHSIKSQLARSYKVEVALLQRVSKTTSMISPEKVGLVTVIAVSIPIVVQVTCANRLGPRDVDLQAILAPLEIMDPCVAKGAGEGERIACRENTRLYRREQGRRRRH